MKWPKDVRLSSSACQFAPLFKSLNRPQYLIADKTGEISVKMFTTPTEDASVNDVVEIYGQVIKRYFVVGDPVVNAVLIRVLKRKNSSQK